MIGWLTGKIVQKFQSGLILDVGGVGYEISVPLSVLVALPEVGATTTLHLHTHVREDDLRLFGFFERRDLTAFRTMLGVSGVGPKLALTILGALSGDQLARAIEQKDTARLVTIPGIGKKTAERIVLELGGKLPVSPNAEPADHTASSLADLASALKNLGFRPPQVERVIATMNVDSDQGAPFEVLLRRALTLLQESK